MSDPNVMRGNQSGTTTPVWYEDATVPDRGPPEGHLHADVCIVGAGIAGLTAAYLLSGAGKSVIVVDEKQIGGGETGRTSAHLASALDDRFKAMASVHGVEATRTLYKSHAAAIDEIERIIRQEQIECGFARVPGYLFSAQAADSELEEEHAAARLAGVESVELYERCPEAGVVPRPCIRFGRQARFHPLRYLTGLARVLENKQVRIFCGERVTDLSGDGPVVARLARGGSITAEYALAATNVPTPINNWVGIYTKQAAYRTFVVGMDVRPDSIGDALYWDMADPYHYVRLHQMQGRSTLLVGGEDHKTGQPGSTTEEERLARLESWARVWFPTVGRTVSRWSGQVNEPDDGVAFIGRVPTTGNRGCYVITGDSGMGLTHGTLGAMLVADLILQRPNPWASVYDPARRPWGTPGEFLGQNLNAVAQMVDHVKPGGVPSREAVAVGTGAVVREGLSLLAVFRDDNGELHTCSAVCPHLKGVVRWNGLERSWDCPCHGSRFDAKGRLLTGPAIDDLPPVQ